MKTLCIILFLLFCGASSLPAQVSPEAIAAHPATPQAQPGQTPAVEVEYPSHGRLLKGFFYLPPGAEEVPAVLWNHGADKAPNHQPELAAFYVSHGFALFVPLRTGHGEGNAVQTVKEQMGPTFPGHFESTEENQRFVKLLETTAEDTAAALRWLKANPRIRKDDIFMSGISYGGLDCLIDANTVSGVRGYIVFSGGAALFGDPALATRLEEGVQHSKAPVLLIQAQNDYSTTPSKVLGPMLLARHDGSHATVYPAFGDPKSVPMGHIAFSTWNLGTRIWGPEALAFMNELMDRGERDH